METEPQPDAAWSQPVQPQTLACFQSTGSTEVGAPTHSADSVMQPTRRNAVRMRSGASHLSTACRGSTSVNCSSVSRASLTPTCICISSSLQKHKNEEKHTCFSSSTKRHQRRSKNIILVALDHHSNTSRPSVLSIVINKTCPLIETIII